MGGKECNKKKRKKGKKFFLVMRTLMIYSLNNPYMPYSSVSYSHYVVLLIMLSAVHSRSDELNTNAHFRLIVLVLKEIYVLLLPN